MRKITMKINSRHLLILMSLCIGFFKSKTLRVQVASTKGKTKG